MAGLLSILARRQGGEGADEGSGDRGALAACTDDLRHADMVAGRIIQLGGTPVTEPKKWYDVTSCGYDAPDDPFVEPY